MGEFIHLSFSVTIYSKVKAMEPTTYFQFKHMAPLSIIKAASFSLVHGNLATHIDTHSALIFKASDVN